jgi:ribulose-5-phosphate 4-epimerase/fuculose-1-phosphate aldolase
MNVHAPTTNGDLDDDAIGALRIDLAAAFRLAVQFNWHESVGNHFSAAISGNGKRFLMNPRWKHFGAIKASDLLLLDADDPDVMTGPNAPDASAWCIHGTIHREIPAVRVMLHCHPPFATALACLKDPSMLPIDQNTARFYGMVGIDGHFGGIADEADEGKRLAGLFGNHAILMMGNHCITITAPSVAEAFEYLYFFERAANTLITAYSTGQPLNVMSAELAQRTAEDWLPYQGMAFEHFDYLKTTLDKADGSYKL